MAGRCCASVRARHAVPLLKKRLMRKERLRARGEHLRCATLANCGTGRIAVLLNGNGEKNDARAIQALAICGACGVRNLLPLFLGEACLATATERVRRLKVAASRTPYCAQPAFEIVRYCAGQRPGMSHGG